MIPYAPLLDTQIPAFKTYINSNNNYYYPRSIKINFTHNMAVAYSDVKGIVLRIKSLVPSGGEMKNTFLCQAWETVTETILKKGELSFGSFKTIGGGVKYIIPGNYYKIQIAYFSAWSGSGTDKVPAEIGQWSTVGISRCLASDTTLSIKGLTTSQSNPDTQTYEGVYTSSTSSEIVYRYKFDLTDEDGNLLETSGWQYPAGATMKFTHRYWLNEGDPYKISLTITTINGYSARVTYPIHRKADYPVPSVNLILVANQNSIESKECGFIDIYLAPAYNNKGQNITELKTAQGVLLRQREGENTGRWDELALFKMSQNSLLENYAWKDFSIEHGVSYVYAIRFCATDTDGIMQWSDLIKSTDPLPNKTKNRTATKALLEHVYLGDGDRQLCLCLNPKVSSFKETILEQKTDTIGGKYPYFFRNGDIRYKEIPISGLISYWMDENGFFMGMDAAIAADKTKNSQRKKDQVNKDAISIKKNALVDLGFSSDLNKTNFNTSLSSDNFTAEKIFKLELLEWLNNGRPKLFRSAAEGNYVIRLMNTSLSPNDQLGRMLHTFSGTGYEILDATIPEMIKAENNVISFPQWITYEDAVDQERTYYWSQSISNRSITVNVQRASRVSRAVRHNDEIEYALVERAENTQFYDFSFAPGIESFHILIPNADGEFSENKYVNLKKENNPLSASSLPAKFAVPIGQCQEVTQKQTVAGIGQDAFKNLLVTSNQYLFSIEENQTCSTNETDLLYDQKIKRLYNLTITPVGTQDAWVDIEYADMTKERLDFSDGLQRVYTNLDNIRRIEKGNDIRLDIYALIQPNASSALDAFILNVSMLGGNSSV